MLISYKFWRCSNIIISKYNSRYMGLYLFLLRLCCWYMPYIYFLSKRVYSLLGKFNFGTLGDAYRPAKISAAVRRRSPSTKVGTALYSPPHIFSSSSFFYDTICPKTCHKMHYEWNTQCSFWDMFYSTKKQRWSINPCLLGNWTSNFLLNCIVGPIFFSMACIVKSWIGRMKDVRKGPFLALDKE